MKDEGVKNARSEYMYVHTAPRCRQLLYLQRGVIRTQFISFVGLPEPKSKMSKDNSLRFLVSDDKYH